MVCFRLWYRLYTMQLHDMIYLKHLDPIFKNDLMTQQALNRNV